MRREVFDALKELEKFADKVKDQFEQKRDAWQEAAANSKTQVAEWPAVTVSYDDDAVYVDADLPGVRKSDCSVAMRGTDAVEISGRRNVPSADGREFVISEPETGEFKRRVSLPSFVEIAVDQVSATMEDGVLRIRLPRRDAGHHRKVEIL